MRLWKLSSPDDRIAAWAEVFLEVCKAEGVTVDDVARDAALAVLAHRRIEPSREMVKRLLGYVGTPV